MFVFKIQSINACSRLRSGYNVHSLYFYSLDILFRSDFFAFDSYELVVGHVVRAQRSIIVGGPCIRYGGKKVNIFFCLLCTKNNFKRVLDVFCFVCCQIHYMSQFEGMGFVVVKPNTNIIYLVFQKYKSRVLVGSSPSNTG